ncbi:hypothetical protein B0I35DRAFT_415473 [Stachybotrys elegans]|uniref:Uncharacterized protein n=1 Tax=Stachybotrys elegans TaxID=80388 RepID=A0A8K0SA41_9HYPO|nr:hypothetical protein B0I35DRAFT_415473 [Stachybotrys elegans]
MTMYRNTNRADFVHVRLGLDEPPEQMLCMCRTMSEHMSMIQDKFADSMSLVPKMVDGYMNQIPYRSVEPVTIVSQTANLEIELRMNSDQSKRIFQIMSKGGFGDIVRCIFMLKADSVRYSVLCVILAQCIDLPTPIYEITSTPNILVSEILMDGSLVYIDTLAMNGHVVKQTLRIKIPTIDLMYMGGSLFASKDGNMIRIRKGHRHERECDLRDDLYKLAHSSMVIARNPTECASKTRPNSMDILYAFSTRGVIVVFGAGRFQELYQMKRGYMLYAKCKSEDIIVQTNAAMSSMGVSCHISVINILASSDVRLYHDRMDKVIGKSPVMMTYIGRTRETPRSWYRPSPSRHVWKGVDESTYPIMSSMAMVANTVISTSEYLVWMHLPMGFCKVLNERIDSYADVIADISPINPPIPLVMFFVFTST